MLGYLVSPNKQFVTKDCAPMTAGHLEVFLYETDDRATTYSDFNGTLNPVDIAIDANGRASVIADDGTAYRIEVYDASGALQWTVSPAFAGGDGAVAEIIADLSGCVRADVEQDFSDEQKALARENIGAVSLEDIPDDQVNADWDEDDPYSKSFIENKPDLSKFVRADIDQSFTDVEKAQARTNIGAVAADEVTGSIVYITWDGTTNIYSDIAPLMYAGKTVLVKNGNDIYVPLEYANNSRICFMSMPTSYVVYYLEFYPGGNPGFKKTTQVNAIIKYFNSNASDEDIWTGTAVNNGNLNVYEDANKERYIAGAVENGTITFYNINPDSQTLAYSFTRSGTYGNYTYSHTTIKAQQYPTVTHVPTSSEYRTTKAVRVALARIDNFAQTAENTPKTAEFEIICSTGDTTPNGNPNSSFSMHVLITAKQNGGPIKVDCHITGNNGWDMEGAMPTISAYDTNNSNGVVIWFGLMSSGVWQDFEHTHVTLVNLKPDVKTLGTLDSVKSYANPIWHPDTVSSLPSNIVGGVLNVADIPIGIGNAVTMGTIGPVKFTSYYYTKSNTYSTMYAFNIRNAIQNDELTIDCADAMIVYPFREWNGAPSGSWYDDITQIGTVQTGSSANMAFTCGVSNEWETSVTEPFFIEGFFRIASTVYGKKYTYKYSLDKNNNNGWLFFKIELINIEDIPHV